MGFSVSGVGSMNADIKTAMNIARAWAGEGKGLMGINAIIEDQVLMLPPWVLKNCHGLCFLFFIRAGFLWSGELGTGFVISKINRNSPNERWSAPTAITSGGMSGGFMVGAQKQFHVVVLNSANALRTFSSRGRLNIGGDVGVAAGPTGRNADLKVEAGTGGIAASYSYSYCQGLWAGVAINGAVILGNPYMNKHFYNRPANSRDLLLGIDGLDVADSNYHYRMLHEYLARTLTPGGPRGGPPRLTQGGMGSEFEFGVTANAAQRAATARAGAGPDLSAGNAYNTYSPAGGHSGADAYQRSSAAENSRSMAVHASKYAAGGRGSSYPALPPSSSYEREAGRNWRDDAHDRRDGRRADGSLRDDDDYWGRRDDDYDDRRRGDWRREGGGYDDYNRDWDYDRDHDRGYGRRYDDYDDYGPRDQYDAPRRDGSRSGSGRPHAPRDYDAPRRDDRRQGYGGSRDADLYPTRI